MKRLIVVAVFASWACACGGAAEDDSGSGAATASGSGNEMIATGASKPLCLAMGSGTELGDGKRFTVLGGQGHHESLKFKTFEFLQDVGKNKTTLTVKRDGKAVFQGLATSDPIQIVIPVDGGAAIEIQCESSETSSGAETEESAGSDPICLAMGSGTELGDGKPFTVLSGGGHHESLKFENFELLYDEGKNKNPLTVKRDGKVLFQSIGTPQPSEIVIPLDGGADIDIQCQK